MTRDKLIEKIVEVIKKEFPKASIDIRNNTSGTTTWISVNKQTFNKKEYKELIRNIQTNILHKNFIKDVYFIEKR